MIALGVKPVEMQNPLAIAQQGASLQNAINQNQLFKSRVAAGQAFQRSIGPDGTPNQNLLLQGLAGSPDAAASAQESAQAGQTLATTNYNLSMKQLTYAANGAMQILADNGGLAPRDAVKGFYDRAAADGHITPAQRDQAESGFTDDPAQNASIIRQRLTQNLSSQEAMQATTPGSGTVDSGPSVTGVQVAPRMAPGGGGAMTPVGPSTPVGFPTPAVQASQVTWKDQNGVEQYGTYAQYAAERGMGHVVTPPTPVTAPGNGRMPPLAAAAAPSAGQGQPPVAPAPGTPVVQAPSASPPSGLVSTSGPAPGVVEAGGTTGLASAKMGTDLTARADQVPTNKSNYANMLNDLQKLNSMGPGTGRETLINGFVQKLTGMGISMDRSQIAGAESFAKIANMIAASQLGSLGPTDARQSLAMGANPHLDLSKLGNEQIIHMLQGNEDAIAAKNRAWQQWIAPKAQGGLGNSPATYGQFSNDFNHNFDPRVFQQQYMTPQEISQMRKSMNGPGEVAKFKSDFTYAKQHGWLGGG